MVNGLQRFKEFFEEYSDNYVLIGGTACSIIFDEIGIDFRATKDLDIVLIIENIPQKKPEFLLMPSKMCLIFAHGF